MCYFSKNEGLLSFIVSYVSNIKTAKQLKLFNCSTSQALKVVFFPAFAIGYICFFNNRVEFNCIQTLKDKGDTLY